MFTVVHSGESHVPMVQDNGKHWHKTEKKTSLNSHDGNTVRLCFELRATINERTRSYCRWPRLVGLLLLSFVFSHEVFI